MFHRDYLQRMIERFGVMLQRLIGLRLEDLPDEAMDLIEDTYDSYFPFPPDKIRHTEPEDIEAFLEEYPELTEDHWSILAELLKEEGELWYQRGEWQLGDLSLQKAIRILQWLNEQRPDIYSFDRNQKLTDWESRRDEEKDPDD